MLATRPKVEKMLILNTEFSKTTYLLTAAALPTSSFSAISNVNYRVHVYKRQVKYPLVKMIYGNPINLCLCSTPVIQQWNIYVDRKPKLSFVHHGFILFHSNVKI